MIAAAGLRKFRAGVTAPIDLNADAALPLGDSRCMRLHRLSLFNTKKRQEFVRITDEVAAIVKTSGVKEGTVLVSAMHITSGRLRQRLGGRADPRFPGVAREARAGGPRLPPSSDRRRQRRRASEAHDHGPSGDAADHRRRLDLGPWEQVFYAEFDGQRKKRVVVKVMGI